MAKGNAVTVRILGDSSGFEKTLDVTAGKADGFGKKLGAVFGGMQLDRAAQGVIGFAKDSVEAFKESQVSAAKLQDAFERYPALNDSSAASFGKLNEALAKKTKFDDDATAAAQANLAQFGLTGKQIEELTPLVQDYAAKTGKDLATASTDLGKALKFGTGKALKDVGIDIKDAGEGAVSFDKTIGLLRGSVGGFATKEGQTAAGKAEILKNQFGELQETVGSKLLPALTKLADIGLRIVEFFSNLSPTAQKFIGIGVALAGVVFGVVKAQQAWAAVQAALNIEMGLFPAVAIALAIAALVAGVIYAYQHCETFRDVVDTAFSAIKTAFFAVADAGKWLWENALKPAFEGIGGAAMWLWNNAIKPYFGFVKAEFEFLWKAGQAAFGFLKSYLFDPLASAAGTIKDIFGGIAGAVGTAFSTAWTVAKGPLNLLIGGLNLLIDGVNKIQIHTPSIMGHGGFDWDGMKIPHLPMLAEGGIVTGGRGGTLAMLGEGVHDELVSPLDGRHSLGGGGDTYSFDFRGAIIASERDAEQWVTRALERHLSAGGQIKTTRGQRVLVG